MARFVFRDLHTYHQAHQRGISWEMVEYALDHPENIRPARLIPGRPPTVLYVATLDSRRLRVYVEMDSDALTIATVAWEDR